MEAGFYPDGGIEENHMRQFFEAIVKMSLKLKY